MAYRDNWLRHLMAPFCGEGLSEALARDFWRTDEDLWSPEHDVGWRWLKLVWAYAASAVCQVGFSLAIAGVTINVFKPVSATTWSIGLGAVTGAMLLFAGLIATSVWIDVSRRRRGPPTG
ncbi:MAG: hypothetical protein K2W80_16455 [Burkholderiales bacterium]|nr:hypothetical protein [Burkholderiales bacterium]